MPEEKTVATFGDKVGVAKIPEGATAKEREDAIRGALRQAGVPIPDEQPGIQKGRDLKWAIEVLENLAYFAEPKYRERFAYDKALDSSVQSDIDKWNEALALLRTIQSDKIDRLQARAEMLDNALAIAVDCSALCVGCREKVRAALMGDDFKPGTRVTDKTTRTMSGVVVEPEPPITAHNVGQGNVLIKWDHADRAQPERIELLARGASRLSTNGN